MQVGSEGSFQGLELIAKHVLKQVDGKDIGSKPHDGAIEP